MALYFGEFAESTMVFYSSISKSSSSILSTVPMPSTLANSFTNVIPTPLTVQSDVGTCSNTEVALLWGRPHIVKWFMYDKSGEILMETPCDVTDLLTCIPILAIFSF